MRKLKGYEAMGAGLLRGGVIAVLPAELLGLLAECVSDWNSNVRFGYPGRNSQRPIQTRQILGQPELMGVRETVELFEPGREFPLGHIDMTLIPPSSSSIHFTKSIELNGLSEERTARGDLAEMIDHMTFKDWFIPFDWIVGRLMDRVRNRILDRQRDDASVHWQENSDRMPHGTKAQKARAFRAWIRLDPTERPRLYDWLAEKFGTDSATGMLNVPISTFRGWRRYLRQNSS